MTTLGLVVGLSVFLSGLGMLEHRGHRARLARLPIRIHVNGTRGKSSVTRLVAAGLRSGGIRACAKTTGTLPRFILPDGTEVPVFRPARANVIEQTRIVKAAVEADAQALVIECMALQPYLQWLMETGFIRATHGVITNARPDHLDVMGPTEEDVARALLGIVPPNGKLFTTERDHLPMFAEACADRGCELIVTDEAEVGAITGADLAGFAYQEHAENVALALRICEDIGVAREVALRGMWSAVPDPGAMTEHRIEFFGRDIRFVNGFAANDPESTELIWDMALGRHEGVETRIALFNCRADRADRSRQLGHAYAAWSPADHVVLMGTGTYLFARSAVDAGVDPSRIVAVEDDTVDRLFETLVGLCGESALVMGMGNIGGDGLEVVRHFRNRVHPARRKAG